ncbi:MAG: CoA-binding protein, partial [Rhodocyclales bacterium]|nr:CoA-binding protein [Rhodocyclales bacterium]
MTVRNLEFLFRPKSVAVVCNAGPRGGSPDAHSADGAGRYAEIVLRNLAAGGFAGPVIPATAKKHSLFGLGGHIHIDELEVVPDLAIICAALGDVPQIITQLGARGTRAAIVGPSMRGKLNASQMAEAHKAILDAARPTLMRIVGPGSGGLVVPASGLNASVASATATPGKIALVAQSTAVAAAVLDRACSKGI